MDKAKNESETRGQNGRTRWIGMALILGVAGMAAIYVHQRHARPSIPSYMQKLGGNFTLQSADGPVHLSDFHGDLVLLYFGYTHCPDACPMALTNMAAAIRSLPKGERARVHGVFVSLDPRRDSPDILKKYVHFYDPSFVGVTGTPTELKVVAQRWNIAYSVPAHPKDMNYTVQHSTFIYLINANGKAATLFGDNTPVATMKHDIEAWMP